MKGNKLGAELEQKLNKLKAIIIETLSLQSLSADSKTESVAL